MSFTIETEQSNEILFLDVNVIGKQVKFTTSIYRKPTFSGVYAHSNSYLPNTYKIGVIYILNRCFRICSNWSMFHS